MSKDFKDQYGNIITFNKNQRDCVQYRGNEALLIKGLAGSGKTIVLAKIAKKALSRLPHKKTEMGNWPRICFVVYNKALAADVCELFETNGIATCRKIDGSDNKVADIFVTTINSLCLSLKKQLLGNELEVKYNDMEYQRKIAISDVLDEIKKVKANKLVDSAELKTILTNAYFDKKEYLANKVKLPYPLNQKMEFWEDEIQWMFSNGIVDESDRTEYLKIKREGRCKSYTVRLDESARNIVFDVFEKYIEKLHSKKR